MARPALIDAGGAIVIDGLLRNDWLRALREEGLSLRASAIEQRKRQPDPGGWRAGNPSRFLATAQSGPVLEEIYADPALAAQIGELAGHSARSTGARGSYSYYDRPGHFLGLHRDIRTCDVTLIICLDRQDGSKPSGALRLYPGAMRAPLDRAALKTQPYRDISMQTGQSVLLLGGCIPHEVLPAAEGFRRAIAVLCFEMTPAGAKPGPA